jgi:hypothetical protein
VPDFVGVCLFPLVIFAVFPIFCGYFKGRHAFFLLFTTICNWGALGPFTFDKDMLLA